MSTLVINPIKEKDFRIYLNKLDTLSTDDIDYNDVNKTAIGFFMFHPERMELEQELNDILDKHRCGANSPESFYQLRDELKTKIRDIRTELTELNSYTAKKHYQEYKHLIDDTISWANMVTERGEYIFMLPILTHYLTQFRKTFEGYNH